MGKIRDKINGHYIHAVILVLIVIIIIMGIVISILYSVGEGLRNDDGKSFFENRDLMRQLEVERSKIKALETLPQRYFEELKQQYE